MAAADKLARTRRFIAFAVGVLAAFVYWQLWDMLVGTTERLDVPAFVWFAVFAAVPFLIWFRFQSFVVGWVAQFFVGLLCLIFLNPFIGHWVDNLSMQSFARAVQLEMPDGTQNFRGRVSSDIFTHINASFEIPKDAVPTFFERNGFLEKPNDPGCWSRRGVFDLDRPDDVKLMKQLDQRFQSSRSRFLKLCLSETDSGTVRVQANTSTN
jgi:hypothetical protein